MKIFLSIALIGLECVYGQYSAFVNVNAAEYPDSLFYVTQKAYTHGQVIVKIIQVKRKNPRSYQNEPYFCRVWINVEKNGKLFNQLYYSNIMPLGGWYGIFVPHQKPSVKYLAVIKRGDYDGRLVLIDSNGEIINLIGGAYIITKDKRFILSEYECDATGLAVFDLKMGKVVYKSSQYFTGRLQWYSDGKQYLFTESDRLDSAYFYDFKANQLRAKNAHQITLSQFSKLDYDFDLSDKNNDCTCDEN